MLEEKENEVSDNEMDEAIKSPKKVKSKPVPVDYILCNVFSVSSQ